MAQVKISQTQFLPQATPGALFPLAAAGDATARCIALGDVWGSLPEATPDGPGACTLAHPAQAQAADDGAAAVTPQSLAGALGARHFAPAGALLQVSVAPPGGAAVSQAFLAACGRRRSQGDLALVQDAQEALYLLVWNSPRRRWQGLDLYRGAFVSYGE